MLYIGSDHGGYKKKEALKKYFDVHKISYEDVGPKELNPDDDYPKYAAQVADKVSKDAKKHTGVLLCRSGQGVAIVANKFKGVRAALVWNKKEAEMSKKDDMTNVLCLPSDYISDKDAPVLVSTWLKAKYATATRHKRRIKEIGAIEKKNFR